MAKQPTSNLVFGNVKHPPFEDRLIPDAQNVAWDNLGARRILGVAQHTMVGTLMGTDAWFRRGAASNGLTDYGIGDVSDGAGRDGVIFRWNDPRGRPHPGVSANRWGWASGPCNDLKGDGPAFVKKYGPNAVNGYLVSIERSDGGNPERAPSDNYLESFCTLTAYWADQANVPWDKFPINPATGLTFYYGHFEFTTKSCPGYAVRATIPASIERIRGILKAAQTAPAKPIVPAEEDPLSDIPKSSFVLDPTIFWENVNTSSGVGKVWSDYGEATGLWGSPGQPWNDLQSDGSTIYVFDHGLVISKAKDGTIGIVVKSK